MSIKSVALVAHDHKKKDLIGWIESTKEYLSELKLFATGTTGKLVSETLGRDVNLLLSGPLGGDQQIGAKIAEGEIDMLIFFWDPLEPMPHDPDIKALIRIAVLWQIPIACNQATADFLIRSPLMNTEPTVPRPNFSDYTNRSV